MIGYFTDFRMLEHLPYDVRQNTDLSNHLRQFPVNTAPLERASGLANRYLYSLEINFNSNLLTYLQPVAPLGFSLSWARFWILPNFWCMAFISSLTVRRLVFCPVGLSFSFPLGSGGWPLKL